MKRLDRWIAAGALVGLNACCGTVPLPRPTFINYPPQAVYTTWRWIGLKRDLTRSCPGARGWRVDPLFDLRGLPVEVRKRAEELGLGESCSREWASS